MRNAKLVSALICSMLFSTTVKADFSCSIVGSKAARVQAAGEELAPPLVIASCEGVRVLVGNATLCYMNQSERKVCRQFSKGDVVSRVGLDASKGVLSGVFATVVTLLKGDASSGLAGARGQEGAHRPLPNGRLLGLVNTIRFDFSGAGLSDVKNLSIWERSNPKTMILSVDDPGGQAEIEVARFSRGKAYAWKILSSGQTTDGQFILDGSNTAQEIRAELDALAANESAGQLGIAVLQAESLYSAGYVYEAAGKLMEVGLEPR